MKISAVLMAARDYLMEHGWTQLGTGFDGHRRCAVTAVDSVHDGYHQIRAENFLKEAIGLEDFRDDGMLGPIARWNNHPNRKFNEVIDAFDRAIILAKEQEA